jgi:hypothetical protein
VEVSSLRSGIWLKWLKSLHLGGERRVMSSCTSSARWKGRGYSGMIGFGQYFPRLDVFTRRGCLEGTCFQSFKFGELRAL